MAMGGKGGNAVVEQAREYWRVPSAAQEYDRIRFNNLWGLVYRWREENAILRALRGVPPNSTVLDAACGTGRVTALLRRNGFRSIGCDISIPMMTVARQRMTSLGYEVPFVASDALHLPYASKSFDVTTCIGLLMHLDTEARVAVLRELARVTRQRLVVQYGRAQPLNRARARITGRTPGKVRYALSETEMRSDLDRTGLGERDRFWVLRGFSSSVVLQLSAT
jgi:SAM-dependent methyltransferase